MLNPNMYFPFFASGVGAWIAGGLGVCVLVLACIIAWRMLGDAAQGGVERLAEDDYQEDCAEDAVHHTVGGTPDEEADDE